MTEVNPESVVQDAWNTLARNRLADPMVTEEPRTESTLDTVDAEFDAEFDDAPGSFEDDVLSRLENLDTVADVVREQNERILDAMTTVVSTMETIAAQVDPVLNTVTESRWFRMMFPKGK